MKTRLIKLFSAALCLLLVLSNLPQAAAFDGYEPADLEVKVGGTGTFCLKYDEAEDSDPIQTLELKGSGSFWLTFTHPGEYKYEIYSPDARNTARYTLHCAVLNAGQNKLNVTAVMSPVGSEEKFDVAYYPIIVADPPVAKRITGDSPRYAAEFRFLFKAVSTTAEGVTKLPMPKDVSEQSVIVTVLGASEKETGYMSFYKPGTYVYEITELDDGLVGYRYDKTVYRVIYEITAGERCLECKTSFLKDGEPVELLRFEFANGYTTPRAPRTADPYRPELWSFNLGLSLLGLLLVTGYYKKRTQ